MRHLLKILYLRILYSPLSKAFPHPVRDRRRHRPVYIPTPDIQPELARV